MNYKKLCWFGLLFLSSILSAQTSSGLSDVETRAYMDERKTLQSRFSVAQSKLAQKPEESSADAQSKMEEVAKDLDQLAQKTLSYESGRLATWNNQGFWMVTLKSGKVTSYWMSGPSAKFVVQKLEDQIAKIKTLKVTTTGPFKKPDLNESQKMLDAIRTALELDVQLTQMAKQYLNR